MRRLSWSEIREYWESHADTLGALDTDADPDALGNVVWPGQPLWLNEHLAAMQQAPYRELLQHLPPPGAGSRALDVGCGSGRWSRLLRERGYDVVGIDLQEALIELDRRRYPDIDFEVSALQDFDDPQVFDLVSSVTVIQHNPVPEQVAMAQRMRELLPAGGHAILLENIRQQGGYVFSHTVAGWAELFAEAGFELVATRAYDFSPALRGVLAMRNGVRRLIRPRAPGEDLDADLASAAHGVPCRSPARRPLEVAMRGAVAVDRPLERALISTGVRRGSVHCGFLFKAV